MIINKRDHLGLPSGGTAPNTTIQEGGGRETIMNRQHVKSVLISYLFSAELLGNIRRLQVYFVKGEDIAISLIFYSALETTFGGYTNL